MARPDYEDSDTAPGENESSTGQDESNVGWYQLGMPAPDVWRPDHE